MPRILRNYLISFVLIGGLLLLVDWIDQRMKAGAPTEEAPASLVPGD
ncbi:MAG: hypothetical protein ACO4AU_10520 [bacterium]|jgi:hypothetical protein